MAFGCVPSPADDHRRARTYAITRLLLLLLFVTGGESVRVCEGLIEYGRIIIIIVCVHTHTHTQ